MLPAGIGSFKLRHPTTFVMTEVAQWCTDIASDVSQDSEEVSLFNPGGTIATKITNYGAISRGYTLSIKWKPENETFFNALQGALNVPFEFSPRGTAVGQTRLSGGVNVGGWAGPGGSASGSWDATITLAVSTDVLSSTIVTTPSPVTITTSSVADPTLITTSAPHLLAVGSVVVIAGHTGSTPTLNGAQVVTAIPSATTFNIPVSVTVGGTGGTVQD
jgi:hypothetical protein